MASHACPVALSPAQGSGRITTPPLPVERRFSLVHAWIVFFWLLLALPAAAQDSGSERAKRGEYIFALAGGCGGHTVPKRTPHAGGRAFPIPMGTAYSTNITQDKETGLGSWTDAQIHDAMVKGIRPSGERLLPLMPYEGTREWRAKTCWT